MKLSLDMRAFLPVMMIVLPAFTACERPQGSGAAEAAAASAAEETIDWARVDFTVHGMDCAGCAIGTRTALKKLDGVRDAGASFGTLEASSAWAIYDSTRVTPERMMEKIRELGYTPELAEGGPR